jgi:hypothetical protein
MPQTPNTTCWNPDVVVPTNIKWKRFCTRIVCPIDSKLRARKSDNEAMNSKTGGGASGTLFQPRFNYSLKGIDLKGFI